MILANRYGEPGPDGKSYTHLEYEYAISQRVPVLAFLNETPENLSGEDSSPQAKTGLIRFRELIKQNRLCRFWSAPQDLALKVTQAIMHAKAAKPGGGWIKQTSLPREVFAQTSRGRTVFAGLSEAGVKDIELWNLRQNSLPPETFFTAARAEIVVSGATAYTVLNEFGELLSSIAKTGKSIYFLLLHPELAAVELEQYSSRENRHFKNMLSESHLTLKLIRDKRYLDQFHFRFRARLAPFTAVMVDGDVEHFAAPADDLGQLRIHPCSNYGFGSKGGLIIHLTKERNRLVAFDYYAADLHMQWAHEGKEDQSLLRAGHY